MKENQHPGMGPGDFPDGGLQAWLVVSGAFCCLFCSFGWINGACSCFGLRHTMLMRLNCSHWGISGVLRDSSIGRVLPKRGFLDTIFGGFHDVRRSMPRPSLKPTGVQSFLLTNFKGPIWGKLYDSYGPRYLILTGSVLHVFGLMMTSIRYVRCQSESCRSTHSRLQVPNTIKSCSLKASLILLSQSAPR